MSLYLFNDNSKNVQIPIYFIHIPKCAGTTVEHFFESLKFDSFLATKDYFKVRQYIKVPPVHFDISLIEKIFQLDKVYSFAIVRNPYHRMLSDYKWAKTKKKRDDSNNKWAKEKTEREEFFSKLSFEEFCTHCITNYRSNNNFLFNHVLPQHKFISSSVNRVFRLEDGLENAINKVFLDVGLKLSNNITLPKINASVYEEIEINKYTKDLIYDFYKEDFVKFNYER